MSMIEVIERRLRKDNGLIESFKFFRWECFPKTKEVIYYELEGGVCVPFKSGKRKGQPNYRKATERKSFVVTVEQAELWQAEYEKETGLCRECMGKTIVVSKVSLFEPTQYRKCGRCNGTGKAPCNHVWKIDGQHSNEYCGICFVSKPERAAS